MNSKAILGFINNLPDIETEIENKTERFFNIVKYFDSMWYEVIQTIELNSHFIFL